MSELAHQSPGIVGMLLLVFGFLRFISEERKARDKKDDRTMAAVERMDEANEKRAKECHRTQTEATEAIRQMAKVVERLPAYLRES